MQQVTLKSKPQMVQAINSLANAGSRTEWTLDCAFNSHNPLYEIRVREGLKS